MINLKLKMREALNQGLEYFKSNKNDPYEAMKLLKTFGASRYLFVDETMEDCLIGKRSTKRILIILIFQLSIWMCALRCLAMSYYNNRTIATYTGDFTYLYPRPDILNTFGFILGSGTAIAGKNSKLF